MVLRFMKHIVFLRFKVRFQSNTGGLQYGFPPPPEHQGSFCKAGAGVVSNRLRESAGGTTGARYVHICPGVAQRLIRVNDRKLPWTHPYRHYPGAGVDVGNYTVYRLIYAA